MPLVQAQVDLKAVKTYAEKPVESVRLLYEALETDRDYKHGFYKLYYLGKLQVSGFYYKNQKQGKWEIFRASGKLKQEAYFLAGKRHGDWKLTTPDNKNFSSFSFQHDVPVGTWRGLHSNGEPAAVYNYVGGRLEGEFVLYYPNGLIAENTEIHYKDTNQYVSRHRYYSTGRLYEEAYFLNDKPDSLYKRYHINGLAWEIYYFDEGQLLAMQQNKSQSGNNLLQGRFENGKGEIRYYNADATIHSQVNYRNGYPSGKALYFRDKNLTLEGVYMGGTRIGTWRYYSEYGKLLLERNFYDGSGLVYERSFSVGGKEGEEGEYVEGLRDGLWKTYNFYGEVVEEIPYHLGYRHGTYQRFDGNLVAESGGYHYGEKVGEWKYYNRRRKVTYRENFVKDVRFDTSLVEPRDIPLPAGQKSDFDYLTPFFDQQFPSGGSMETNFIFNNMKLPEAVNELDISGELILQLTVSEIGEITDIEIIRGLGYGIEEEVIRLYKSMPFWEPRVVNGLPEENTFIRRIFVGADQ